MKRAVARVRARIVARVVARLGEVVPEAGIEEREEGVVVGARGLKRRWVEDPSLAWWRQ